jgi:hypothetical protein
MADATFKTSSGDDLVLSNDDGSKKIEVPESGDVEVTGDFKATNLKATNLKANDGTAGLSIADSTGRVQVSEKIEVDDIIEKTTDHGVEIDSVLLKDGNIEQGDGKHLKTDEVRAIDGDGLKLRDSGGSDGIFVENGGQIGIGTDSPSNQLHVLGNSNYLLRLEQSGTVIHMMALRSNTAGFDIACDGANNKVILNSTGSGDKMDFCTSDGNVRMSIASGGAVSVSGSLSKGSGSFRIDHPLESKSKTHDLVHSFIEGPQADLIYRGKVKLVKGEAKVNLDTVSNMTEGTFVLLNTNLQTFTTNETGFSEVKSSISGNILTITSKDTSSDTISWMVIGERNDPHMYETEWTDKNGKVIVEPEKEDSSSDDYSSADN